MGASNLVLNSEETSLSLYTIACPELQRRDAVGNRLSTVSDSGWTYDSSNHLTSRPGVTYTYDNNGNTATKVDSTGTTTYAWNYDDQLASATLPGSAGTVTFKYDPFGRRIQKASPSGTTNYLYDGANVIEEVDGTGTVLARYSQGAGIDQPLDVFTSGGTKYYDADGLGSITSLADISGSLTDTYTTDSFGKATASSGTTRNPFRYTARDLDSETGLMYYRARYYDPQIGRFISDDPLRFSAGANFYSYVQNRPTLKTDPDGLHSIFFDGTYLRLFDDDGVLLLKCRATTGNPGSGPLDQAKPNYGPIPRGSYWLDPAEYSGGGWRGWVRSNIDPRDWGHGAAWRVPLHPFPGTNTQGRSDFLLHGGDKPGSAGCIDTGHCNDRVHDLLKDHQGTVRVDVRYTNFTPF